MLQVEVIGAQLAPEYPETHEEHTLLDEQVRQFWTEHEIVQLFAGLEKPVLHALHTVGEEQVLQFVIEQETVVQLVDGLE